MFIRILILICVFPSVAKAQVPLEARYFQCGIRAGQSVDRDAEELLVILESKLLGAANAKLVPSLPAKFQWSQDGSTQTLVCRSEKILKEVIADLQKEFELLNKVNKEIWFRPTTNPYSFKPNFVGHLVQNVDHIQSLGNEELIGAPVKVWVSSKHQDGFLGTYDSRAFYFRDFDLNAINAESTVELSGMVEVLSKRQTPAGVQEIVRKLTAPEADSLKAAVAIMYKDKPVATSLRTWSDNSGLFTLRGEFLGMHGKLVELRSLDGSTISVPLSRFSDLDRLWIKAMED